MGFKHKYHLRQLVSLPRSPNVVELLQEFAVYITSLKPKPAK